MPSFLGVVVVIGAVLIFLLLLLVVATLISPQIISGSLSEPTFQPCNLGKQWVLFGCKPNPITGLGCVMPGSNGQFITYKTVAVQNPTCQPQKNGDLSGERVVSFIWNQTEPAGPCKSTSECCVYSASCTRTATYICVRTTEPVGGENQCKPEFLPIVPPNFNDKKYDYSVTPIVLEIPCRENFCSS